MAEWLLLKRGLYYRPNGCGYTGIRDDAGRYTEDDARAHAVKGSGVTMVRLDKAPEFSKACFEDLALAHLKRQRDEAYAFVDFVNLWCNRDNITDAERVSVIKYHPTAQARLAEISAGDAT